MRPSEVWRTSSFRLSVTLGLLFVLGTAALLTSVDLQASAYLDRRVDRIIRGEADALLRAPRDELPRRLDAALQLSAGVNVFALFSPAHAPLAGDLSRWPERLRPGGAPMELPPRYGFPAYARMMAFALPHGEVLVVGRDVRLTRELRAIIGAALAWSGAAIVAMGVLLGVALSLRPIRRLRRMQAVAQEIAAGDLTRRMPQTGRGDELDRVAAVVNAMLEEVDRLMREVKSATDTVAHDLRTPLTHVRARLHRLAEADGADAAEVRRLTAEVDEVLERFRALMRLSELELSARQAGFTAVDLGEAAGRAVELYTPLAEESGVSLGLDARPVAPVRADPKLMVELVSNLLDNAVKFAGVNAHVRVVVEATPDGPRLLVEDDGPGIAPAERAAVLSRFYRGQAARMTPGAGLGLSVVAAIARLHRFDLHLADAEPGLRVVLDCRPGGGGAAEARERAGRTPAGRPMP